MKKTVSKEDGPKKVSKVRKMIHEVVKTMVQTQPDLVVEELLAEQFWLKTIKTRVAYQRLSDDTDGTFSCIEVSFSPDNDGWVTVMSQIDSEADMALTHRYRFDIGGGRSPHTRTALLILARAIDLDNQERPQKIPPPSKKEEE